MRVLLFVSALLTSAAAFAHTPVCRCELKDGIINCQAGYHDGTTAKGVPMRVMSYSGATLASGELDQNSRFSTDLPTEAFYILMDVGPGEMFEVDWRDVKGVDSDMFTSSHPLN